MTKSLSSKSPFQADILEGKVALITGGASGIGYGITLQLLLHGCSAVVIVGRRENFLQDATVSLSRHLKDNNRKIASIYYYVADVRDSNACRLAVEYCISKCQKLDILINCAAGNFLSPASQLSPKGFHTVLDIDANGTYNMSYHAYPYLKRSNKTSDTGGTIINISATLQYGATFYQVHASAAKSAVDSMTRSLALEWGYDGVRVNAVAPGPIQDTPGTAKLAPITSTTSDTTSNSNSTDLVNKIMKESIPLGRMGHAIEIGYAVVFLASELSAAYINGTTLVVDGGQWLYRPPFVPKDLVSKISRTVEKQSRDMKPTTTLTNRKDVFISSKI